MLTATNQSDMLESSRTFLVYGQAGTGKTRFAASFPKPVFFMFDPGGAVSIRSKVRDGSVKVIPIDTLEGEAWTTFTRAMLGDEKACAEIEPAETIIIDTLTSYWPLVMEGVMKLSSRDRPTLAEWGMVIERIRFVGVQLVRFALRRKKIVVMIAHEQMDKDELSGQIFGSLNCPGKSVGPELEDMFSEMYRLTSGLTRDPKTGNEKRTTTLWTAGSGVWKAKSRFGLPPKITVEGDVEYTTHILPHLR